MSHDKMNEEQCSINLSVLRQYTDGDVELEKMLISTFYEKAESDLKTLSSNIVMGESIIWSETAHSLKGSACYIGANRLCSLCSTAQDMVEAKDYERAELYKKIICEYEVVCKLLAKEFP